MVGSVNPLFDAAFYLAHNRDVGEAGIDPYLHYLSSERRRRKGRQPHPLFDPAHYLEFHPEYQAAWANPLEYFMTHDAAQGPDPHPLFSSKFYLEKYPDVKAVGDESAESITCSLACGNDWEGRDPHPLFQRTRAY